jgi:hypothetical protein
VNPDPMLKTVIEPLVIRTVVIGSAAARSVGRTIPKRAIPQTQIPRDRTLPVMIESSRDRGIQRRFC